MSSDNNDNTIAELKCQLRDKSVEKALYNRKIISDNWSMLVSKGV